MAGYTRQSTFADGDTITAALFNNEYNQLLNAFSNTGGHKHDGTAAEGPVIGLIGDAGETSPNNKVLIDTTNNYIEFYVEVSSAPVQQLYIADGAIVPVTDSDIDLGTTSLRFKDTYTDTITTTGNATIGGNLTVTGNATISGNLTFGDADTDSINLAAEIDSDIIPNTDGTYDLGSATKEWQDLYIDGTANIDSLVADTADINGGTIDGATIATSDITVGAGKTLNVSAGTLTLADNQISGDKVEGGTIAATTITTLASTTGNITTVNSTTTNATTVDSTNLEVTNLKAKDGTAAGSIADSTGVVTLGSSVLTTTDINGGTIDGVTIGGTSAGAVTFTDLSDGTITITAFADEDDMSSDSATLVPTQQSVKAYVDSQVTAQDLDFQGDTGGALSIDLDSESLTIAGGTGLDTVGSGNTVTVNIDATVATLTGTQTLTNKTLTSPDVNTPDIDGGTIDGTVIGGATPAAGTFTTLTANTSITGTLATAAQPNITSVGTLTGLTTTGDINFGDNDKAIFGAGSDLEIYHNESNSIIRDVGTGDLRIQGANLQLLSSNGKKYLFGVEDAYTKLYYDNSEKIATSSTGIDVTGTVVADGLTLSPEGSVITFDTSGTPDGRIKTGDNIKANSLQIESDNAVVINSGMDDGAASEVDGTFISRGSGFTKTALFDVNGDISFYEDTGTSQALFWDASAESLGIGTTSPNALLDISSATTSTLRLSNSDTALTEGQITGQLEFYQADTSSQGTGITGKIAMRSVEVYPSSGYFGNAADMDFYVSGSANGYASDNATKKAMTIQAGSGNVGIGTTSPSGKLEVKGSGTSPIVYFGNGVDNAPNRQLAFSGGSSGLVWDLDATGASSVGGQLTLSTNGSEAMRIDSSGNVGIGTTSPNSTAGFTTVTLNNATSGGIIDFENNTSLVGRIYNTSTNFHVYNQTANSLLFGTSGTEKMRIDSSGNVGIGTSSPSEKLSINNASGNAYLQCISGNGNLGGVWVGDQADNYVGGFLYDNNIDASLFYTNNAEAMRINSSGNVGIGVSPSYNLDLLASNAVSMIRTGDTTSPTLGLFVNSGSNGVGTISVDNGGHMTFDTGASGAGQTERIRIDSSGRVGIGTTVPSTTLSIQSSGANGIDLKSDSAASTNSGRLFFSTSAGTNSIMSVSGNLTFRSGSIAGGSTGTERMRIDSSGNVLVGTTSPLSFGSNSTEGVMLEPNTLVASRAHNGALYLQRSGSDGGIAYFYRDQASVGNISVTGSATSYNTSSDYRLKDVTGSARGLEVINELNPVSYNWKADGKADEGLIAQEVLNVVPNAVSGSEEEMYQMDYSKLVVHLVAGMKEQQAQIEALQSEINELKNS